MTARGAARALAFAACAAGLAGALAGCGSGGAKIDPILELSAEEALTRGKELFEQEKYRQAQPYLTQAFEVAPNSPSGREALLLAADAYYFDGGDENFIRAESKYRDFLNRFPTSDRAAYAQFQAANSLAERMRRPDRDQSATREALEAYEEVVLLFPTSEYAEAAEQRIVEVRALLAEAEFLVGRFYFKVGLQKAAVARFERIVEEFPDYPEMDKALYFLGRSNRKWKKPAEAIAAFDRLRSDYPESPFIAKEPEVRLPPPGAELDEDAPVAPEEEPADEPAAEDRESP